VRDGQAVSDLEDVIEEARQRRVEEYERRQQNKVAARSEHARARTYGLPRRHARKLQHIERGSMETTITAPRLIRCRYLDIKDNRCTAEVVDEVGEILLCVHHLAKALELIRRRAS
jgi:hypothetical protein